MSEVSEHGAEAVAASLMVSREEFEDAIEWDRMLDAKLQSMRTALIAEINKQGWRRATT